MKRSPELESIHRRLNEATIAGNKEAMQNLISTASQARVVTAIGEWISGQDEIVNVSAARHKEAEVVRYEYQHLEGFEQGEVGWTAAEAVIHTTTGREIPIRQTTVLTLESGVWRVVQLHASTASQSVEVFGYELTDSLQAIVSALQESESSSIAATSDTVTVMFTDIEDSTVVSEDVGNDRWAVMIADHFALLDRLVGNHNGTTVKRLGDGTMAVFASATSAIRSAVEIQEALASSPVRVRIGIHTGDSRRQGGDYYGVAVNKAARIANIARGGEILVSAVSAELTTGQGVELGTRRSVSLKGLQGTHDICTVFSA